MPGVHQEAGDPTLALPSTHVGTSTEPCTPAQYPPPPARVTLPRGTQLCPSRAAKETSPCAPDSFFLRKSPRRHVIITRTAAVYANTCETRKAPCFSEVGEGSGARTQPRGGRGVLSPPQGSPGST